MHSICKTDRCPGLPPASPRLALLSRIPCLAVLLCAILLLSPAVARAQQTTDDRYVEIYNLILQGDRLSTNQPASALAKYRKALADLNSIQTANPFWNQRVVEYRQKYLGGKIAALAAVVEAPPPKQLEAAPTPATAAGQVNVIVAGAEPRQQLRLHPKPGDKQTQELSLKMKMEMSMAGTAVPPMKFPPMIFTMEITTTEVAPNGDISYEMVMKDCMVEQQDESANPKLAAELDKATAGLKGLSGSGKMTSRGVNLGFEMNPGKNPNQNLRQVLTQLSQLLDQLVVVLPEVAVGTGAKWEVKLPAKSEGLTIDQTSTYELVSREGERCNLKVYVSQSAANQKMAKPPMPGMKAELVKLSSLGSGDLTLDLTRVSAPTANLVYQTDTTTAVEMAGQKQNMSMKMGLTFKVETK